MAHVTVTVNGRSYTIACDDGEEKHLVELAQVIDRRVAEIAGAVGQVGDSRLLLMASLLIADELGLREQKIEELDAEIAQLKQTRVAVAEKAQTAEGAVADVLESAAARIEEIAARVAAA
ncbi:MAG TPA: cell division protein ZapA [Micropepsaceae bacterium]|nr:cell division protein ZapA [Micropepsaceae bacterium]